MDGKKPVKSLSPYSKDSQSSVNESFIDYETGQIKQGLRYFKPLSKTILRYVDHPEHKYQGNEGLLTRRKINVDGILIIGKEANKIEDQPLFITDTQIFKDKQEIARKILALCQCDAERAGVGRSTLKFIKDGIKNGKEINLKTKAVKRLLKSTT